MMTPREQAQEIVETHCPQGGAIKRRALTDAIRWALVQADIAKRQPPELSPSQAGAIVYQILFFVDEWTRMLNDADYPAQANALTACRRKVLEVVQAPRKPMLVEAGRAKKAKGAHA